MKILTVENKTYELDDVPELVDDLRYGVLDYSDPKNVDYFFIFRELTTARTQNTRPNI